MYILEDNGLRQNEDKFYSSNILFYSQQNDYIEKIRIYSNKFTETNGHAPKYFTQTFGCQQNQNDTEKMRGMLSSAGYEPTEDKAEADLILFNTCAVRDHAEQKVYGCIGALQQYKRLKPSLIIAVCGCMTQQEKVAEEIKKKYKQVNLLFGTKAMYRFPENLFKVLSTGNPVFDISESGPDIVEEVPISRDSDYKAWVSIMYGCNNFCSYCIVPYVRGRERSRKPEDVISEIKKLVSEGYKDITLLGQNVNSYCKDSDNGWNFSKLLRAINDIEGDFRIRFMTSHPKDASFELFDTIAECDKICKHIHLPFQSGSDCVLKAMNRRYTRKDYLALIEYAKNKIPGVVFTSDVIVGFPTETEEDFQKTLELVREVGFGGLYTFIYSPRKGTPAAEVEQIPESIKHERFDRLLALQNQIAVELNEKYIGKTLEVMIDGYTDSSNRTQNGRTDTNIIVNFPATNKKPGEKVKITVNKALNWALFGEEAIK